MNYPGDDNEDSLPQALSDTISYLISSYCKNPSLKNIVHGNSHLQITDTSQPIIFPQLLCFFNTLLSSKEIAKKYQKVTLTQMTFEEVDKPELLIFKDKQFGNLPIILKRPNNLFYPHESYESDIEFLFEYLVGLHLNLLKVEIPNFVYTYFMFFCDQHMRKNKPFLDCEMEDDLPRPNLFLEYIKGETFSVKLCSDEISLEKYLEYLLQVLFSIQMAQDKFRYCHTDLHGDNVIIKKLDKPITIRYHIRNTFYFLTVTSIAVIIDFGIGYMRLSDTVMEDMKEANIYSTLEAPTLRNTPDEDWSELVEFRPDISVFKLVASTLNYLEDTKLKQILWLIQYFKGLKYRNKEVLKIHTLKDVKRLLVHLSNNYYSLQSDIDFAVSDKFSPINLANYIISNHPMENLKVVDISISKQFVHNKKPMFEPLILEWMLNPKLEEENFVDFINDSYDCIKNVNYLKNFQSLVFFIQRIVIFLTNVEIGLKYVQETNSIKEKKKETYAKIQTLLSSQTFIRDKIRWDTVFVISILENKKYIQYMNEVNRIISSPNSHEQQVKMANTWTFKKFVEMMNEFLYFSELIVNVMKLELVPEEIKNYYSDLYQKIRHNEVYDLYYNLYDRINLLYEIITLELTT